MKNKIFLVSILFFSLFYLSGCHKAENSSEKTSPSVPTEIMNYRDDVKIFDVLSAKELTTKNLKNVFLYVGSETCPYCREYVSNIKRVKKDHSSNLPIYYLDATNLSDSNLQNLLKRYDIESIPILLHLKGDGSFEKTNIENYNQLRSWIEERI